MNQNEMRELGIRLRQRRLKLGLGLRELARRARVGHATLVRLEQGSVASPNRKVLLRISEALEFNLADVFAFAGTLKPAELPSFQPYLRVKYPRLPQGALDELTTAFTRVGRPYGYSPIGPTPEQRSPAPRGGPG